MDEDGRSRDERLDEAWKALEEGLAEDCLSIALALVTEDDSDADAHLLAASALMEADRLPAAEPHLRKAIDIDPSYLDARATLAELLYELCRFDESRAELGMLLEEDPEDPHAHHLASLLAERSGEFALSEEEERMAHRLAPETYSLRPRFTRGEFDRAVESAMGELPDEFRERMGNLAVVVEDVPSEAILVTLAEPSPGILGLFVGTPLPEKSLGDIPSPPDAIYLFKRNLERICESRDELVDEIRITLLHEVGHFLGLDEQEIADAGYE